MTKYITALFALFVVFSPLAYSNAANYQVLTCNTDNYELRIASYDPITSLNDILPLPWNEPRELTATLWKTVDNNENVAIAVFGNIYADAVSGNVVLAKNGFKLETISYDRLKSALTVQVNIASKESPSGQFLARMQCFLK
jgi:hypothetical protein